MSTLFFIYKNTTNVLKRDFDSRNLENVVKFQLYFGYSYFQFKKTWES